MQEMLKSGFDPWLRKIPSRRAWQPTLVFLPGEFYGQRRLAGYSPWVAKLDRAEGLLSLSTFYMVQLSYLYMTTGKAIALTTQTFVSKVISLLFNILSRFVMAFLPRSKSLNFMAAVTVHSDFGAQENKICRCFHFSLFFCHDVIFSLMFAMK